MLDTPEGAERLHRAILARAARVSADVQQRLRVAVVGGDTTGVEFAADLGTASGRLAGPRKRYSAPLIFLLESVVRSTAIATFTTAVA